jgi:MerR family copper efflux transcriptional regulator
MKAANVNGSRLTVGRTALELRVSPRTSCAEVRARAEAKIVDVEARIRSLRQMSRALGRLAHECKTEREGGDCPLLKHLEGEF